MIVVFICECLWMCVELKKKLEKKMYSNLNLVECVVVIVAAAADSSDSQIWT